MCANAYCEDCLPADYEMMGECELFQSLGQIHPKQACFILCGKDCQCVGAEAYHKHGVLALLL